MNNTIQSTGQNILAGHASLLAAVCAAMLLTAGPAQSQMVYRVVGPDGSVTFSDKPPLAPDKPAATVGGGNSVGGGSTLPYELRQVASKYSVTLYTSSNCAPCGSGRALLSNRGIPFTEKTVNTAEDVESLQRLSGDSSLPFLTIGSQQIKGFADAEWTQFLDAAGYPKSSVLPANYRAPVASPLVSLQKPAAPSSESRNSTQRPPAELSRPSTDTRSNPAGIKF